MKPIEGIVDRYFHPINRYAPGLSELIGVGQVISGLSEAIYGAHTIGTVENEYNKRLGAVYIQHGMKHVKDGLKRTIVTPVTLACVAALCVYTWTVIRSDEREDP